MKSSKRPDLHEMGTAEFEAIGGRVNQDADIPSGFERTQRIPFSNIPGTAESTMRLDRVDDKNMARLARILLDIAGDPIYEQEIALQRNIDLIRGKIREVDVLEVDNTVIIRQIIVLAMSLVQDFDKKSEYLKRLREIIGRVKDDAGFETRGVGF